MFFPMVLLPILFTSALRHPPTKRALQETHEKSPLVKWEEKFLKPIPQFDRTSSLVALIGRIAIDHLAGCTTVILYDSFTENSDDLVLENLFRNFPMPYVHGQVNEEYHTKTPHILTSPLSCVNYVIFLKDVMRCKSVVGPQSHNKVVLIARSSQWRLYEFLANEQSQHLNNLLLIAISEKIAYANIELPYILYTHKLYIDALGSSIHQVLTSWRNGSFTRPHVNLFPPKLAEGFSGHRFIISLAHQPPFVIKKGKDDNDDVQWDGIEIRLVNLLATMYNFTTDYREAKSAEQFGSSKSVTEAIQNNTANIGIGGLYVTNERIQAIDTSYAHSQDCAAFISLTSTALPRYRAIMGPFHWSVWLALTFVYLFAIFPLAFSDRHTLKHLIEKPQEVENMFWYVFGTFTNAFTFLGHNSWSNTDKVATRLLIGFYWLFTIIITACYTGSIIAFVTLPVYPETVDTPEELIRGGFRVGTLDKNGWPDFFTNSSDPYTAKLLKNIELVSNVESGLRNTTKAFFWPYAFLGSRAQLDYIVRTNFSTLNKRSILHISSECFVPFGVSLIYYKDTLYSKILDVGILRIVQSGIIKKLKNDVEWFLMRSATGKLLAANSYGNVLSSLTVEDRALTLDDTQGMFLLLALGFILGGASLLSEWLGGCMHLCKGIKRKRTDSIQSNYRSHDIPTPREKLDSLQYNTLERHIISEEGTDDLNESNCVVHQENQLSNENIDEEIDRLFNFQEMFGDENSHESNIKTEELNDNY